MSGSDPGRIAARAVPGAVLLGCVLLLGTVPAAAQTQTEAARLRDALRRTTIDLRAAQDSQAALQAALDQAQHQRDALQQQLAALTAQLAQASAPPQAPPAPQADAAQMGRLKTMLDEAQAQTASLQAGLAHWQSAYQEAATIARTKDAEGRRAAGAAQAAQQTAAACGAKNDRLAAVARDILNLYRTQDFRSLLLGSYEPVLGLAEVRLENVIQDNEDRILEQKYYPNAAPAASPAPPSGPAGAAGAGVSK